MAINKRAIQPEPSLPGALEFECYLKDGQLVTKRMTKPTSPHVEKTTANAKMINVGIIAMQTDKKRL